MALEHAIVVSLLEQPGSGYELARRFDRSIGYFWGATHQQIYRVLKRMADAGWVRAREVAQQGKPDKKVYAVTALGRRELAAWVRETSEVDLPRSDLAVKLRGAAHGDPAALLADVEHHRETHAQRLALFREIEKHDPGDVYQHLVLRGGIQYEEGWLAWCDEVLEVLRKESQ